MPVLTIKFSEDLTVQDDIDTFKKHFENIDIYVLKALFAADYQNTHFIITAEHLKRMQLINAINHINNTLKLITTLQKITPIDSNSDLAPYITNIKKITNKLDKYSPQAIYELKNYDEIIQTYQNIANKNQKIVEKLQPIIQKYLYRLSNCVDMDIALFTLRLTIVTAIIGSLSLLFLMGLMPGEAFWFAPALFGAGTLLVSPTFLGVLAYSTFENRETATKFAKFDLKQHGIFKGHNEFDIAEDEIITLAKLTN